MPVQIAQRYDRDCGEQGCNQAEYDRITELFEQLSTHTGEQCQRNEYNTGRRRTTDDRTDHRSCTFDCCLIETRLFFLRTETSIENVDRVIYHHSDTKYEGGQRDNVHRESHRIHTDQCDHNGNRDRSTYDDGSSKLSVEDEQDDHREDDCHNHRLHNILD